MAKAYKGLPMEGVIATWYATNTAADLSRFTQTARILAERLRPAVPCSKWLRSPVTWPSRWAVRSGRSLVPSMSGGPIRRDNR